MIIFADASALISLFYEQDPNHERAVKIAQELEEGSLMISNYTFSEIVTILSQRVGKEFAIKIGEHIKKTYLWTDVDRKIEDLAWEIFKEQKAKNVSLVDCTIIALYQKGVFDKCFAFDEHFKKNKLPILE